MLKNGPTNEGYNEEDFNEKYWTEKLELLGPRINKDHTYVKLYLEDLFKKFGVKGTVLDVGAGAGNVVNGLRRAGIEAEGCEFSDSGRKLSIDKFNIELKKCDLRKKLPYKTNSFDWVLCIGVLSMIPKSFMRNAISELLRVSSKGVLVNVQTIINEDFNSHHITSHSFTDYWQLFAECGAYDITSIQPPQKRRYGIGVADEFAGLFSKNIKEFVNV